ncbi:glycosyltransferase family 4 protein [Amylibacter sp. SFDW26]|uniref:glycosyltransferase family 4 protein n=1 Tax=Amylibacter sp. SFDW26 TaxID=2652722 RepID=UPI001261FBD1|nr:glycosyltransferase family 4 protein [Amylibacter sp. SFDW26]KAB7610078.1 glycosyltransferase family 4 protein [Amylibacter sp. SFDW26]
MATPNLFVTNFNKNFTGVSATAAGVIGVQQSQFDMKLVGVPLPSCPTPISKREAFNLSKAGGEGDKPFAIWHVRRNPEMRTAIWARDVLRLPIKIVFTSAAQRFHSMYPRWLISKMDAVIATTPEAAKYVDNVRAVVPHGVDTSRFCSSKDKASAWQALGYGGKCGVATIGRVRPEKGTDVFVKTMLKVLSERPDLVALIVGKASKKHEKFQQDLMFQISEAGLSDRLLFVGELGPDKMPALMQAISLLVALPRYEGYGMTPLEGLASGTPFVASNTGYFEAFSNEGNLGTVVPLEDAESAARAIGSWLSDEEMLNRGSKLAPAFIAQQHSVEKEAAGIAKVYEGLWNGTNHG